jgi:hypothetical protein
MYRVICCTPQNVHFHINVSRLQSVDGNAGVFTQARLIAVLQLPKQSVPDQTVDTSDLGQQSGYDLDDFATCHWPTAVTGGPAPRLVERRQKFLDARQIATATGLPQYIFTHLWVRESLGVPHRRISRQIPF